MIDERSDTGSDWDLSSDATSDGGMLVSAFVCGALTGLSLGVLLAPARGRDTRRRIGSAARRTYRRMRRPVQHDKTSTPSVAAFVDRTRTPPMETLSDTAR